MSSLELAGFVQGVVEPSIKLTNLLHNHLRSYHASENTIKQLISSLSELQRDLTRVDSQLHQCNQLMSPQNFGVFKDHLIEMTTMFTTALESFNEIDHSTIRTKFISRKAVKWAEKCESIQSNINDAQHKILQISSFFDQKSQKSVVVSPVKEMKNKQIHDIGNHDASSSTGKPVNKFKPYFVKLPVPSEAKLDFDATDPHGNPSTMEANLQNQLVISSQSHEPKIFAIHGPGGVGKTTCTHALSHEHRIRQYFFHGVYYLQLGPDVNTKTVMGKLVKIVRNSGGMNAATEAETAKSIDDVISNVSKWFRDKRYLLLLDDVWERAPIGSRLLMLLKSMISGSDEGAVVFTTRDKILATNSVCIFPLDSRDPLGVDSRAILFRYAKQNPKSVYKGITEETIETLLQTCEGLPIAHSFVGKGVLQLSMRRNVGTEDAWQMYAQSKKNALEGIADDPDCLFSVFKTAVHILEEARLANGHSPQSANVYCYGEMHRSLCVLEKQQWAPIDMLQCIWSIENEVETRRICEKLVLIGLAEWKEEEMTDDGDKNLCITGISTHNLIHDFATEEAKERDEIETWHRRLLEGYVNRKSVSDSPGAGCREWWKFGEIEDCKDESYFMKNLCRHLYYGDSTDNEVVMLVTRPEWILLQLQKNGRLQCWNDVQFGFQSIRRALISGTYGNIAQDYSITNSSHDLDWKFGLGRDDSQFRLYRNSVRRMYDCMSFLNFTNEVISSEWEWKLYEFLLLSAVILTPEESPLENWVEAFFHPARMDWYEKVDPAKMRTIFKSYKANTTWDHLEKLGEESSIVFVDFQQVLSGVLENEITNCLLNTRNSSGLIAYPITANKSGSPISLKIVFIDSVPFIELKGYVKQIASFYAEDDLAGSFFALPPVERHISDRALPLIHLEGPWYELRKTDANPIPKLDIGPVQVAGPRSITRIATEMSGKECAPSEHTKKLWRQDFAVRLSESDVWLKWRKVCTKCEVLRCVDGRMAINTTVLEFNRNLGMKLSKDPSLEFAQEEEFSRQVTSSVNFEEVKSLIGIKVPPKLILNVSDDSMARALYLASSWFSIEGPTAQKGKDCGWGNRTADKQRGEVVPWRATFKDLTMAGWKLEPHVTTPNGRDWGVFHFYCQRIIEDEDYCHLSPNSCVGPLLSMESCCIVCSRPQPDLALNLQLL